MKKYHKNPRQITGKQASDLTDSLDEFGDLSGIVHDLNSDEIIGGNRRGDSFNINHCEIEITHRFDEPDEQGTVAHGFVVWRDKRYAYRQVRWMPRQSEQANIQANKLGGSWDFDILANEFDTTDLLDWGFEEWELGIEVDDEEPADDPGAKTDRAEELREKWGVETGQMWACGEHRIICGDCTDPAVVERVMDGKKADITFTSPPYNVAVNSSLPNKNKYHRDRHKYADHDDDKKTDVSYLELITRFTNQSLLVSDFVFVNIQSVAGNKLPLIEYLYCFKNKYADTLIWDKMIGEPAMAENVLNSRYEYIHVFSEKANRAIGKVSFRGTIDNVLTISSRQDKENSDIHKATYPLEFVSFFIDNFSELSCFDPFLGSGTTLIACEQLGRRCRGIEISPAYIAVTLERYFDMTNDTPQLIPTPELGA